MVKNFDMTLQQINEVFMSEEEKTITLKLLRNSLTLIKEFILKDPIPYQRKLMDKKSIPSEPDLDSN